MTDDEKSILMIAGEGKSMIPIGRWKPAVHSLALLGHLRKIDAFNYIITEQGRKALEHIDEENDEAFRTIHHEYAQTENHRTQMLQSAEQSAIHLSHAAKASVRLTGRPANQTAWELSQSILQRALTLLESESDRAN